MNNCRAYYIKKDPKREAAFKEKATELKKRLWFTVAALIAFRLLSFIPLPGIDPLMLSSLFQTTQGGMLDLLNMFSAADWNA